ncbi:hypothetical protein ACIBL8_06995 [Streptomyces sp. NPDC050523]|uniref:hypothetical protein n=1 Tax=Streptomyces sp. NPDC050523 TaxID=3365622 RepID=UPI00378B4B24
MSLPSPAPTRRVLLRTATGLACAAAAVPALATAAEAADSPGPSKPALADSRPSRSHPRTGSNSVNGWPMEKGADIGGAVWTRALPGTGATVAMRLGAASAVLVHVISRYHYEIAALEPDDVQGFKAPRGLTGFWTNYASGTAVAIRPGAHPPGVTGSLFPAQRAAIADIVADCAGVVRWGGTFNTPYEAHFQIDVPPSDDRLARLADRIGRRNLTLGQGPGTLALRG